MEAKENELKRIWKTLSKAEKKAVLIDGLKVKKFLVLPILIVISIFLYNGWIILAPFYVIALAFWYPLCTGIMFVERYFDRLDPKFVEAAKHAPSSDNFSSHSSSGWEKNISHNSFYTSSEYNYLRGNIYNREW